MNKLRWTVGGVGLMVLFVALTDYGRYCLYYDLALVDLVLKDKAGFGYWLAEAHLRAVSAGLYSSEQTEISKARIARAFLADRREQIGQWGHADLYAISDPTRAASADGLVFVFESAGRLEVAGARIEVQDGNRCIVAVQGSVDPSRFLALHFPSELEANDLVTVSVDAMGEIYSLEVSNDWNLFETRGWSKSALASSGYSRWEWKLRMLENDCRAIVRLRAAPGTRVSVRNIRMQWDGSFQVSDATRVESQTSKRGVGS